MEAADLLRVWAEDAAEFARVLARLDPSWGSDTFPLAGGHVVLQGPGLYVNVGVALGLDAPLSTDDWDELERRSASVGVPPSIEVTPSTHPTVAGAAAGRGYVCDGRTSALRLDLAAVDLPPADDRFVVEPANGDLLPVWQETSAAGWGHASPAARRASDAFARAAAVVDGDGLVLVRSSATGEPVGCASLTRRAGVATLGGMSTVPSARRTGVQTALVHHRLRVAVAAGCTVAASTAVPDGQSERNLIRLGFERTGTIETWTRPTS